MICSSSSKATTHVRTAWFPLVMDVQGASKELHIAWKYSKTALGLFSPAGSKTPTRPPRGSIIGCRLEYLTYKRNERSSYLTAESCLSKERILVCVDC